MTQPQYRYSSPPNWPAPPPGWTPPQGWAPPADWPPAPAGWQFWVPLEAPAPAPAPALVPVATPGQGEATAAGDPAPSGTGGASAAPKSIGVFGARKKARELTDEVEVLRAELARVGAMDAIEIDREREVARERFGADQAAMALERMALEQEQAKARQRHEQTLATLERERDAASRSLTEVQHRIVQLEETALLQEVGVYDYQHPLDNAEAYKERLATLRSRYKEMAKSGGGAIEAASGWTVNGSVAQGKKMITQYSRLMLRAYNAEVDTLLRGLKPHRLAASVDRLEKTAQAIAKLGATMSMRVAPHYHDVRIRELRLTADYLAKVEEEKEASRAAREALREQRKVEQEMARAREKLDKEREHYANALAALRAKGDDDGAARLEAQLADVDKAIADVDYRAANQRAGYVYVISNIGAFGDGMIKVGMTRRLDPMDRVRELGDASVPFGFDVHALFFSEDAVGIENEMHARLAERRVNRVNLRREYFYATPHEALEHLRDLAGEVLSFEETPEALEYRQSQNLRSRVGAVSTTG